MTAAIATATLTAWAFLAPVAMALEARSLRRVLSGREGQQARAELLAAVGVDGVPRATARILACAAAAPYLVIADSLASRPRG